MTKAPSEYDDILDSRDIDERIEELEDEQEEYGLEEEDKEELDALVEFRNEVNNPEWQYGLTLVHDSYFVEYAKQLAEDLGLISSDAKWPSYAIDWEKAANDLKMDYSSAEFKGQTFWFRE